MTLRELLKSGVSRVYLERWALGGYLQFTLFPNGTHGPWVRFVSPVEQKIIEAEVPQMISVFHLNMEDDEYLPYKGAIREGDTEWDAEKHGVEEIPEFPNTTVEVHKEDGFIIVKRE